VSDPLGRLRRVAAYQFGAGCGAVLLPPEVDHELRRSNTGRPRQVHAPDGRVATLAADGRFRLGRIGARRLVSGTDTPTARVVVGDESEPHVRDGRNAFARFVRAVDSDVRPGDEVVVVGPGTDDAPSSDPLAVGRAVLPAAAMHDFDSGEAVAVRHGFAAEADAS
jgi:uncharacterized protein with predicted RNA binding PUA domain